MAKTQNKNTWSGVSPQLALAGGQAIMSGEVPLKAAHENAMKMGLLPQDSQLPDVSSLSMAQFTPQKNNLAMPLPGQPPLTAMGGNSPGVARALASPDTATTEDPSSTEMLKGEDPLAYWKRQGVLSQEDTRKEQKNKYMDPEQVQEAMDTIRKSPEMQDLQQGEGSMRNALAMAAAQPNADPGWVKPLLALTDSWTGSKTMAGYTPGVTPHERTEMLLKYQDEIQKRKADIVKTLTGGLNASKNGGFVINTGTTKSTDTDTQGKGGPNSAYSQTRRNALIARAGESFDNDIHLKSARASLNMLQRAQEMMSSGTPITATDLNQLQIDLSNAMAPGGTATNMKIGLDIVHPFAAILNSLVQRGDSIQDLRRDDPHLFKQFQQRLSMFKNAYEQAAVIRAKEKFSSWKDVPDDLVQSTIARKLADWTPKGGSAPTTQANQTKSAPSAQDNQAIQWARKNPGDPRAAQILHKNGVQ